MKAALGLTLTVAGLYLLTASGHLDGQDQEYYFRMARALAHERAFAIEPLVFQNTEIAGRRGREGQFYAEYAPGLPLAMAPLIALADFFPNFADQVQSDYHWMRDRENDLAERIFVSYFDAAVIAAIAGVLVLLVTGLGYSGAAAMLVAGIFAFSTFAWGQARTINPEPLQTFFILLAILLALRTNSKNMFAAGCALGCAILVKLTAVLAIPALFVLAKPEKKSLSSRLLAVCSIALPVLGALSIYAWYNYARFGNVWATGYNMSGRAAELGGNGIGNPVIGFFGLIVSPGRGLIWYAPPVLAASLGYRGFFQRHKLAAISFALLAVSWIGLHSCYQGWDSGWGWGPRYLLPILPILLVATVESLQLRNGIIICLALALAGFFVQLPGALVDFMASGRAGMNLFAETTPVRNATAFVNWRNFHPSGSEIVRHFALLREGKIDVAWLTFQQSWIPILTLCLATGLAVAGLFLIRSSWRDQKHLEHNPMKA